MTPARAILAASALLLLASGCSSGGGDDTVAVDPQASDTGSPAPVVLTVRREALLPESGAMPIEGTVSTFVLRDEAGAEVEPEREDADGAPSYADLTPGVYTLTSQEYFCIGSCEVAGEPVATCEEELDLTTDTRVTVRVLLGNGPCEIVSEQA